MKNNPFTLAVVIAFLCCTPAMADNDLPGADWMPVTDVMQKLQAAGYSNVTGLHADDGHWEGKGVKNGQVMEFHVDPHSGALTKEEVDND